MSFETMAWAIKQKTGNSITKLILLSIADRVNKDTGYCYPSINRIAEDCECSRDTVKRHIKKLEERNLIKIIREKTQGINLPNKYYIDTSVVAGGSSTQHLGVGADSTHGRCRESLGVGAEKAPNLEREPIIKPISITKEENFDDVFDEMFEELWIKYERKGSKKKTKALWNKLNGDNKLTVMDSLSSYFQERPDKQYRKDLERYIKDEVFIDVMERARTNSLMIPKQNSFQPQQRRGREVYDRDRPSNMPDYVPPTDPNQLPF